MTLTSKEEKLLLVEYEPLRNEVNRTIDRMNTNEAICGAFVFSVLLFQASSPSTEWPFPTVVGDFLVGSVALLVAIFGYKRSLVFRSHLELVDDYLEKVEREFSEVWGWTTHYRASRGRIDKRRITHSRVVFWHLVRFLSFLNLFLRTAQHLLGENY